MPHIAVCSSVGSQSRKGAAADATVLWDMWQLSRGQASAVFKFLGVRSSQAGENMYLLSFLLAFAFLYKTQHLKR